MKYKVGDKVRVRSNLVSGNRYGGLTFFDGDMSSHAGQICTIKKVLSDKKYYVSENPFAWSEEMLEPVDSTTLRMADGTVIGEFAKEGIIGEFKGIPIYATGGTLPTSEWSKLIFKNGSSIEVLPQKGDAVRGENHFCNGFKGGKIPECVLNEKQAKEYADNIMATSELISHITGISYENSINKLKACLSVFSNDGISAKNGGKNSMKFTFYFNVNEGTRVDKSCNGTIPTITTSVVLDKFGDPDRRKCYSLKGEATCDKVDYDMRQGVLEALANAVFDGNFEKAYDKAVKTNAFCERQDRTCHYCGKVLDTVEEKQAHEAWHVERRKARRERYLLRKRAKEIAFEEQAQKMAKEMIAEDNKK